MQQTILLIEDNQTDIGLTQRAFEKCNICSKLIVKEDGQDALDYIFGARDSSETIDNELPRLVMLDLKMPRIGGFEVLRRIRQDTRTRHIPVVVFTSSAEEKDIVTAYDLGANSYIRKPVDFKQFVELINIMSLYWLVLNETIPRRKQP